VSLSDMSAYDRSAWEDIERWRAKRTAPADAWRVVPAKVRERAARVGNATKERFEDLPGANELASVFAHALDGLLGLINRVADASLRRDAVVAAYTRRQHVVADLADIRKLDLREVDKVKPRLDLHYILASTAEGAAAGFAVSGGEIVGAGGSIASAGAAAAPAAATIVSVMAADAVAVLAAMTRAIAHTAAYYGYDTELPQERAFALGVLNFGLAKQAGKGAAYIELNKIVQSLARNATWAQLNKSGVTKVVNTVYERLGMRLTKEKLGQAVPVLGIAIGAGLNAKLLAGVTADANHVYRERFLREKYDLPTAPPGSTLVPSEAEVPLADDDSSIPIAELIAEEIAGQDDEAD